MQDNSELPFKWLGSTVECPDENLLKKNYSFYAQCELNGVKYEAGQGVNVNVNLISTLNVGLIHYFYEIDDDTRRKFVVAVELFYKPKEISTGLAKPIDLDYDLEVIKKHKLALIHLSVFSIKSRCAIVYGLKEEDPHEILQEFITTISDPLYICRYVASLKNGLFFLEAAVADENDKSFSNNTILEISSEDVTPSKNYEKYRVSQVEIINEVKIILKREIISPKKEIVETDPTRSRKYIPLILAKKLQSPSELIKNLTLSPKKRELPSKEQVQKMNRNFNKRKSTLSTIINSDDDLNMELQSPNKNPVVVLNKIDLNVTNPNEKPVRSCRKNEIATPSRSSSRRTSKVSYTDFYDQSFGTPSKRVTFDESVTPRKQKIENTPRKQLIMDHTPKKQKKIGEETPKKKETPRKNKIQTDFYDQTFGTPSKRVTFDESATPRKQKIENTPTKQLIMDDTPKKQKKIGEETPKKNKIGTPRSGRLNIMTCTPTVEERKNPIVFCDTPMSRARMGLSAYSVPAKVPCRENEYLNIYNFVTGRLCDQSSGCMYISGVPGTGKTMTVCRVMSDLQQDDYDFVFLKLNALALTEPRQVYVEIVKMLLNKKLHWEESLKEMEKFFKTKKKKVAHVLLIDELDKLCNRKQDVVYNLLDLPFHSTTPLIVITIANTMDLPERILTNKVNSRLGLVRLTFKPYQYKDLVKIVTERLAGDAVFKNEALELVARKVAAVSGDARRALAMCARATEVAEEENKELVTMDVVDRVIKEMSSSSKVQAIQCCSKLEQYILTAIANEVTRTGNEEVPFLNMIHNLEKLCILDSFKLPSPEICLRSCHNLGSFRLLITQHGRIDINMTLMLNISTDDVHYALRR